MEPRFRQVYSQLRSLLKDPNEMLYVLHTNVGALIVTRIHWQNEVGYVFLEGVDEEKNPRFVGYSEEQLAMFAFEVKPKSAERSQSIGFTSGEGESV